LSQAPEFVIVKNRQPAGNLGFTGSFVVAHKDIDVANTSLGLNFNTAPVAFGSGWVNALSTSTFNVTAGNSDIDNVSRNGNDYIAYCWHSVPGYSTFGKYVATGSTDNIFIYFGFRPKFLMVKRIDASESWQIFDGERYPYNDTSGLFRTLSPNSTDNEDGLGCAPVYFDFLSNGVKLRAAIGQYGGTCIYAAFAEHPFGGSNVYPANAR
jgi:hypothetical protein